MLVSEPAEIFALNDEPRLDRRFAARGPLVKPLHCRAHPALVPGQWPAAPLAVAPRRCGARRSPEEPCGGARSGGGTPIVDGGASRAARQLCPRRRRRARKRRSQPRRSSDGTSSRELQRRRGELESGRDGRRFSRRLLVEADRLDRHRPARAARSTCCTRRAQDDRHALHGTAIGVHGIVGALDRMRALHAGRRPRSRSARRPRSPVRSPPPKRVARVVEEGSRRRRARGGPRPERIVISRPRQGRPGGPGCGHGVHARPVEFLPGGSLRDRARPGGLAQSGLRLEMAPMSDDVIFTPAALPQPRGEEPHLPLEHLRALRQRGRLAHPDAHQLGMQVRQGRHRRDHLLLRPGADRRAGSSPATPRCIATTSSRCGRRSARPCTASTASSSCSSRTRAGRWTSPGVHNSARPALSSTSRKESLHGFLCQAMNKREIDHTIAGVRARAPGGRARPGSTASSCTPPTAICSRSS